MEMKAQNMRVVEILEKMPSLHASDVFVSGGKPPSFRRDGIVSLLDDRLIASEEIHEFVKDRFQKRIEEELFSSGSVDTGLTLSNGDRYRINFMQRQEQLGLVARLVPHGNLDFGALNLPPILREFSQSPRGLILVVGAAGSGKSTTMAAILNHINENSQKHIVTIEDPIEFVHKDKKSVVTQREVGSDAVGFMEALRSVVRESPDAIFIGEARDVETISIGVTAALTGHLVVTSMHTADVVQSVERIINHYPEHLRNQAATDLPLSLRGIVAQRLLGRAHGQGRVPVVEVLNATPVVRRLIATRRFGELEEIMRRADSDGMSHFDRSLANLCKSGTITLEAGADAATNRDEFRLLVQGMESGIDTFRRDSIQEEGDDNLLNMKRLLQSAVGNGASDLLLTVGSRPCLRINGALQSLAMEPLCPFDTKRLLFSVLNPTQRAHFEDEKEIDFALTISIVRSHGEKEKEPTPFRFRVNGFYQRGNVAVAIRVIPTTIPTPEQLGLPTALVRLTDKAHGLILITGPTGHGKSTTMASLIDRINKSRACHIITIEDPIEYVHISKQSVVEQREVYADTLSFANALKYVLRQDPDVILVGEMRDPETMATALTAAETGHLVMATLHTNDAPQSIDRIIDSFPPHQQNQIRTQLGNILLGIVSQRLLAKRDGTGRIAAFEVLIGSPGVRAQIRESKIHLIPSMIETGAKEGMITMDKALLELYNANLISRSDALSLMKNPQGREMRAL